MQRCYQQVKQLAYFSQLTCRLSVKLTALMITCKPFVKLSEKYFKAKRCLITVYLNVSKTFVVLS